MSKVSAELFLQRRATKTAAVDRSILLPIGAGLAATSYLGGKLAMNHLYKQVDKPDTDEGVRLFKELRKKAKNEGINITVMPHPLDGSSSYYVPDADSITVGRRADLLAHEYGHSQYSSGRGGLVGRIAHKLYSPSAVFGTLNPTTAMIYGAKGLLAPGGAVTSTALPLAASTPYLVAEGLASRKGYKTLKELGASDEYLRNTRKNLFGAWSTYASAAGLNAGVSLAANGLGNYLRKLNH